MGKIKDSITDNYNRALSQGNLIQAKKAFDLAKIVDRLISEDKFIDYIDSPGDESDFKNESSRLTPYKYDFKNGIVVINNSAVSLTESENKLFSIFNRNQSRTNSLRVVKTEEILSFVWPNKKVANGAVRILIKRLRDKIEGYPANPVIIINYNRKGYLFWGKSLL